MSVETKFSKTEVKFLYRAFKSECPNGIIDEDTFKGSNQFENSAAALEICTYKYLYVRPAFRHLKII